MAGAPFVPFIGEGRGPAKLARTSVFFRAPEPKAKKAKPTEVLATLRLAGEQFITPQGILNRRADAVAIKVTVFSDAPDYRDRFRGIRKALWRMRIRAWLRNLRPWGRKMRLNLEKDLVLRPFYIDDAVIAIVPGEVANTSQVSVWVRAAVKPRDTMSDMTDRFDAYWMGLPRSPSIDYRTALAPELIVFDPGQYRIQIIAAINTDVQAFRESLGANYAARLEGVEQRLAIRRASELDVALFIPYKLQIMAAMS